MEPPHTKMMYYSSIFSIFTIIVITYYNSLNVSSYYITTPQTQSDYIQLSKLVVECFESTITTGNATDRMPTMIEKSNRLFDLPFSFVMKDMKWYLYQRYIIQQQVYQQYIYNANRLYTMKHMILLAKFNTKGDTKQNNLYYDDTMNQKNIQQKIKKKFRNHSTVIGIIEFGISMYNVSSSTSSIVEAMDTTHHIQPDKQQQQRRFMIGTICIDPMYRNYGIATQLIHQCELMIIQQQWNVSIMYVHVDIYNDKAITLFTKKFGYQFIYTNDTNNNNNIPQMDMIRVRRRNTINLVPHYLLCKNIGTTLNR